MSYNSVTQKFEYSSSEELNSIPSSGSKFQKFIAKKITREMMIPLFEKYEEYKDIRAERKTSSDNSYSLNLSKKA